MFLDHHKLVRSFCAGGIKGRRQEIDLLSLSIPDYVYRGAHPALGRLQKTLCHFIVDQYSQYLEPQVQTFIIFVRFSAIFDDFIWFQLARRMSEKLKRGHKVKADDIKKVLETVVHKGKLTVWNQLFMLHSQVKLFFVILRWIECTYNIFICVRSPGYRGFAATPSRRPSTTRARCSTTRISKTWLH
jgi:hypothetical protein